MITLRHIKQGWPGVLLVLASCSGVPFPTHTPVEQESTRLFLHGSLSQYQSQKGVIERATFQLGGEEVVLTLYAQSDGKEQMRLAAVSDMGATVFGVQWTPAGLEVLQSSPNFPEDLLREIARDQAVALLVPSFDKVELVRLANGRTALHYNSFGSDVLAFVAEGEGRFQLERGWGGEKRSTVMLLGDGVTQWIEVESLKPVYAARMLVAPWKEGG